jgi:hypothetical protein
MCVCVYIYIYVCVYMYIYIYMHFILSFKVMYLMPEDGQCDRIILDVLTGVIKFVVVDVSIYVECNMIHHNGMNFTK